MNLCDALNDFNSMRWTSPDTRAVTETAVGTTLVTACDSRRGGAVGNSVIGKFLNGAQIIAAALDDGNKLFNLTIK
jgi:hypothetical protein